MPFGQHMGTPMIQVPAHYLLYIYDQGTLTPVVKDYIEDNLTALRKECNLPPLKNKK